MDTLGFDEMVRMLRGAAAEIRGNHETLSRLDSVGGDGDHGTTMLRAMACMEKAIESSATRDLKSLFYEVGWAILGVDGGATGPLLGTFFMATSEAAAGADRLDASQLSAVFNAGCAGVRAQTKAQLGDKTMIDALVPAVEAMAGRETIRDALRAAAEAAENGAAATRAMQAKFGRAKNIREQSIGTQDPGATSVSLIFRGFLKGVENDA